ncbi:hypothetical protein [Beijerinckia sp. L45]|uniref:hypothetical protein n=1 Tax=Beijerinckia sp. L45 TaxID=1641855 RepID=UPI00131B7164|nr:hypothetical protein [Beijerinckia sp. L45]
MTDVATNPRLEALYEANDLALVDATVAAFGRHAGRIFAKAEKTAKDNGDAGAASRMFQTAAMLEDCARDVAALRDPALRR